MKSAFFTRLVRLEWRVFCPSVQVLEWSKDAATALATAIYLNDRYNLDGSVAQLSANLKQRAGF